MEADLALNYGDLWERGQIQISTTLKAMIERGKTVTAVEYHRAGEPGHCAPANNRAFVRALRCS